MVRNNKNKSVAGASIIGLAGLAMALDLTGARAEETLGVDEIVTTTQRPIALRDLAGNMAVVDDLEFVSADHPADALNRLPGVNIQQGSGQEHLTSIRSPVLTGGAGAGSFLYLEDGVPLRSPGFANVNGLFESHTELASRIEVVRGPGSALYGSNAVHGLINVLTMSPTDIEGSSFDFSYGSHDQSKTNITAFFPGDIHNGVLNLTFKNDGGARVASGADQQKAALRTDWQSGDNSFTFVTSFNNLNQETAGYVQGFESYKDETLARSNPNPQAFRDAKALRTYLRWDRDLSNDLSLTITPYFRKTKMDFLMHFLPGNALEKNGHKSFGIQSRLYKETAGGGLIVAGIDLEHTDGFLSEVQEAPSLPFGGFETGTHYDYTIKALLASPYVHTEWNLGSATRLTAGLRIDFTSYDYDNKASTEKRQRYQRPADRTDEFVTATPKLGVTQRLSDELSLFGLYARGQRAPQTTDLYRLQSNQVVGEVDPEIMDSLEIGIRDTVGPLRFEVTGYAMKKENFFFRDSNGENVSEGKTEHLGAEIWVAADINEVLDVAGSLTYGRHTYAFDHLPQNIENGNDIDTAPRLLANLRVGWRPVEALRTELEWVHMDEYYTDEANLHTYEGHDLINLRASYQVNDLLTVYGRVLNVADTAYADRADYSRGEDRYFPGDERFISIGVRVSL